MTSSHNKHVHAFASVVSDSLRPNRLQPARVLCPWGFSRQEYWGGLPFPSPEDLPDPGIKPASLMSPALAGRFFTTHTTWDTECLLSTVLGSRRWTKQTWPSLTEVTVFVLYFAPEVLTASFRHILSLWFLVFWVSFQHDTLPSSLTTRLAPQAGWAGSTCSQILPTWDISWIANLS